MPDAAAMTGTRATPGALESLRPRKAEASATSGTASSSSSSPPLPAATAGRDRAVVHPQASNQETSSSDDDDPAPYTPPSVRRAYAQRYEQSKRVAYRNAEGEDDEEEEEEEYDEQELLRERAEMKAHFAFPVERRQAMRAKFMSAMRRRRRQLLRNENLRFRELYRAPEPMVVVTAIALITIVSLILTKSWPFNHRYQ
ncbi:hypothetical protein PINS_up004390 [Pythium insidiosum]|nr:hypothetical protein PINS_up004390 [Pythium insidiosum]